MVSCFPFRNFFVVKISNGQSKRAVQDTVKRVDVYLRDKTKITGVIIWRDKDQTIVVTEKSDTIRVPKRDLLGVVPFNEKLQGEWRSWNIGDIRNSLAVQSPVIMSGFTDLNCFLGLWCWGSGSGHQWVIDGMKDLGVQTTYQFVAYYEGDDCPSNEVTYYTYSINSTTNTQIHQNWGWGPNQGSDPNDWYAQDVFQPKYSSKNFRHAKYIVATLHPISLL